MLGKGLALRIGLKTNYIEYEDIENPLRSHLEIAIEEKVTNQTLSQKLYYHRNEFNR